MYCQRQKTSSEYRKLFYKVWLAIQFQLWNHIQMNIYETSIRGLAFWLKLFKGPISIFLSRLVAAWLIVKKLWILHVDVAIEGLSQFCSTIVTQICFLNKTEWSSL